MTLGSPGRLSFSTDKRQAEDSGQGEGGDLSQGGPIGSCSIPYLFNMLMGQLLMLHTH